MRCRVHLAALLCFVAALCYAQDTTSGTGTRGGSSGNTTNGAAYRGASGGDPTNGPSSRTSAFAHTTSGPGVVSFNPLMTHSAQPYFRLCGFTQSTTNCFTSIVSPNGTNWLWESRQINISGATGTNSSFRDPSWVVFNNQYLLCWNGTAATNEYVQGSGIGVASSQDGVHFNFIGWILPTNNVVSPAAYASANWGPHWVVDATNGLHIVYWCPTNNQPRTVNATTNGDWIVDVQPFTTNAWNARYIPLSQAYQNAMSDDPSIRDVNGVYYLINASYLYTSFAVDSGYVTNGYLNGKPLYVGQEGPQIFQQPGGLWMMVGTQNRESFSRVCTSPDLTNWTTGGKMTGPWAASGEQGTVIYTAMPAQNPIQVITNNSLLSNNLKFSTNLTASFANMFDRTNDALYTGYLHQTLTNIYVSPTP
jgi:hypothetical protein